MSNYRNAVYRRTHQERGQVRLHLTKPSRSAPFSHVPFPLLACICLFFSSLLRSSRAAAMDCWRRKRSAELATQIAQVAPAFLIRLFDSALFPNHSQDYKLRAQDYHRKKDRLQDLQVSYFLLSLSHIHSLSLFLASLIEDIPDKWPSPFSLSLPRISPTTGKSSSEESR